MRLIFSKNFWKRFGAWLKKKLYKKSHYTYNFGYGRKDPRTVCKYYKEEPTKTILKEVITTNKLKGRTHEETMIRIMKWLKREYPPIFYYKRDRGEKWNRPEETLKSFEQKRKGEYRTFPADCDDYAILIYNLARLAGVPAEKMYLAMVQTITEYHLNIMYFKDGVPYAVEGTYYPTTAIRNFLRVPYFNNSILKDGKRVYYYLKVDYLFNENERLKSTALSKKING